MPWPEEPYARLEARLAELDDLGAALHLLGWDQQTMMPPGGAQARAEVMASLERITHERATDDALFELLEELRPWAETLPEDDARGDVVRVARRDAELARLVPSELSAEITLAAAEALPVWERAGADNDFAIFAPALERNLQLRRQLAACRADLEHPYDALLDGFEPGMTTAAVREIFAQLTDGLVPLIAEMAAEEHPAPPEGPFDVADQRALALEIDRLVDRRSLDVGVEPMDLVAR